jgi:type III pantothenate kinase
MAARIEADCRRLGLGRVLVTGGDAEGLLDAGLSAHHEPSLVLKGLAAVDGESERE